jgi:hypothetical protein
MRRQDKFITMLNGSTNARNHNITKKNRNNKIQMKTG